jgi:hypothetical protein
MKPKIILFLALVLSGVLFGFVSRARAVELATDAEPRYLEKSLSAWIPLARSVHGELFIPGDSRSSTAIPELGTNALPWLLRWIRSEKPETARLGIEGLGLLGPIAKPAIPELVRLVNDWPSSSAWSNAIPALAAIRDTNDIPYALPFLLSAATNTDAPAKFRVQALQSIYTPYAGPVLQAGVTNTEERVIAGTIPWRLVPENAALPLPTLQTNLGLRDAIAQSIRGRYLLRDTKDTTLVEISLQADRPPANSAFDVAIKVGNQMWPLGPVAWMKGKIEGWHFDIDLPEDIHSADLVLTPSANAGARLKADDPFRITTLDEIWNGPPIVLTNIPVREQEISMILIKPPTLRAARNDALDQFDLSDPVIQGLIEDGDWAKAQAHLQEKNDLCSRYNLGCIEIANADLVDSFQTFIDVRQHDLPSQMRQRVQRQLRRICAMYLDRAEKGAPASMCALGAAYEHGCGVKQNFQEAKRWYRDAANAGNVAAMGPLANLYEQELGATVHTATAHEWYRQQTLSWYRRAAAGGDQAASQWLVTHNLN